MRMRVKEFQKTLELMTKQHKFITSC